MRRWLKAGAALGLLIGAAIPLAAGEDSADPNLGGRLAQLRRERERTTSSHYILMQRAQYQSWQRTMRLEAQYNAGLSPNRPVQHLGPLPTDPNAGLFHPYYYRRW